MGSNKKTAPFKIIGFIVVIIVCAWFVNKSLNNPEKKVNNQKIAVALDGIAHAFEVAQKESKSTQLAQLDHLHKNLQGIDASVFPMYLSDAINNYRKQLDHCVVMLRAPNFKKNDFYDKQMDILIQYEESLKAELKKYIKSASSKAK